MRTNRQLLPGDIIHSPGVVDYQVRGSEGCPAALLHCCLMPYHGPHSTLSQPTLKILIISTVSFTESFVWTTVSAQRKLALVEAGLFFSAVQVL